jgi:hypothetical protein
MDLFADEYYELECKNQIDYYKVLFAPDSTSLSSHTIVGTLEILYKNRNTVVVTGEGHIQNSSSKQYCHEVQITSSIKKIILE